MNHSQLQSFLDRISQLESSGGKNVKHRTIKSGLQKGQTAIGRYALLPNTVKEIINRAKRQGQFIPELEGLKQQQLKDVIESTPQLEEQLAQKLAQHVLEKQQGDEKRAAYSWLNGHNLTPERISEKQLKQSDYVNKFQKLPKREAPQRQLASMAPSVPLIEDPIREQIALSNINATPYGSPEDTPLLSDEELNARKQAKEAALKEFLTEIGF